MGATEGPRPGGLLHGLFLDTRYVLVGRDTEFLPFRGILQGGDTKAVVRLSRSPNLELQIERFIRGMKSERLNRVVFFGEKSLRKALKEFAAHYLEERNHQGLRNSVIEPGSEVGRTEGGIYRRERLGEMLSYCHCETAQLS